MKTMKDLRSLKNLRVLVVSCKPGFGLSWSYDDPERIGRRMAWLLVRTVEENQNKVTSILRGIYDRPVKLDGDVSDWVFQLKSVTTDTGKNITECTLALRKYLGYRCTFTTRRGDLIPLDKIKKAYLASAEGKHPKEIKHLLYSH